MLHTGVARIKGNYFEQRLAPAYLGGEIWRLPRDGGGSLGEFSGIRRAERDEYGMGVVLRGRGVILLVILIIDVRGIPNTVLSMMLDVGSTPNIMIAGLLTVSVPVSIQPRVSCEHPLN